ncbi:MAG TPA: bacteriohemerythrin [Dissulfurispiraceae bacterium]|nr:bacteriohemerythrin [Dissulfurispiraceae bacterium]
MALIDWSDNYSVNVKAMDDQHKKLVSIINELNDSMKTGKSKDVMEKILKGLVDYTITHFSAEEALMKNSGYPGYANQKSQHEDLVKKVQDYQNKYHSGQMVMGVEIMSFLKDWLLNHISGLDKKYGPYLNEKGIK